MPLRLHSVSVQGLQGFLNYKLTLRNSGITILSGPPGCGKTALLEYIAQSLSAQPVLRCDLAEFVLVNEEEHVVISQRELQYLAQCKVSVLDSRNPAFFPSLQREYREIREKVIRNLSEQDKPKVPCPNMFRSTKKTPPSLEDVRFVWEVVRQKYQLLRELGLITGQNMRWPRLHPSQLEIYLESLHGLMLDLREACIYAECVHIFLLCCNQSLGNSSGQLSQATTGELVWAGSCGAVPNPNELRLIGLYFEVLLRASAGSLVIVDDIDFGISQAQRKQMLADLIPIMQLRNIQLLCSSCMPNIWEEYPECVEFINLDQEDKYECYAKR